jgi:hypothetical protein
MQQPSLRMQTFLPPVLDARSGSKLLYCKVLVALMARLLLVPATASCILLLNLWLAIAIGATTTIGRWHVFFVSSSNSF